MSGDRDNPDRRPRGRPKKSRKSRAGSRRSRRELTPEDRAWRILRDLRLLGHELARRHGFAPDEEVPIDELVLPVPIPLDGHPKRRPRRRDAHALVRDLADRIDETLSARAKFRPGRVYCFQSNSIDVRHAAPGDPTETFAGYTPTGKPTWETFVNVLLARGDERVDQLWGEEPSVVAIVQLGSELKGDLLPSFGRDDLSFNVLGQVVAGLIPTDVRRRSEAPRAALTVQLVETRQGQAPKRLRMNLLGLSREAIVRAASERPRGAADRLRHTLSATRERIDALGRRLVREERRGERPHIEPDVASLLEDLRRDTERVFRPHRHRTRHAQQRHRGGERPTSSALRDARQAPRERVLFDTQRETFVVIGKRGRAHVFSAEGRHVTSLQLQPGELERKSNRGKSGRARWRPVERADYEAFRKAVGDD